MQDLTKLTRKDLQAYSKDKLIDVILLLIKRDEENQKQIIALEKRVNELEHKLACKDKNSSNSSKPPSSDYKSNKNINLREKSGKPSGGQKGHPGFTRNLVDSPDKVIKHVPEVCECCGKSLKKIEASLKGRKQVVDIPPIKAEVIEHQQLEKTCSCGHKNVGKFPQDVKAPVQFGPIIQALILYFSVRHHIPYNRIAEIMEEIIGEKISERTIENILVEAKVRAGPIYQLIAKYLKSSKYVGSDETGIRVDGINFWLWVWQNELYSYFAVDKSRSYKVIEKYFSSKTFKGTLGHDCHGAQNKTKAKNHQHCHAHYLRALKYCIQEENSLWAYKATVLLLNSQKVRDLIWEKSFDKGLRKQIIKSFENSLDQLLLETVTTKETLKIQKRMIKHREKVLFFMTTKDVPPDNNGSERAIRNAKIHKKVSGCFRSETGAQRYAILMSIIDTAKKQGLKMFDACQSLFSGNLTLLPARQ